MLAVKVKLVYPNCLHFCLWRSERAFAFMNLFSHIVTSFQLKSQDFVLVTFLIS
jgi:hypothetical protein